MSLKLKLILLAVWTVFFLVCGLYLSGLILLTWLDLPHAKLGIGTYWQYVSVIDHPQVSRFSKEIKISGYIGFGVLSILYLIGVFLLFRKKKQSLHGEARFSGLADLTKAGFFKETATSLIVGKKNGKFLYYSGQQFALLAAPTRSGKGVGIVIPNLLHYRDSVVVLDIKQENFELTRGYREQVLGQEVFLLNPFAEDGRTHRWNPLTYVSSDENQRVSDLMSIAAMLYPDIGADQKFWVSQARNAFMAFALFILDNRKSGKGIFGVAGKEEMPFTLGQIYRLASGDGNDLKTYLQGLSEKSGLSEACQNAFATLLSQAEETFSSIMGTFKEPLNPWINPLIDRATSGDDFLLTDVRKKKMTIYIGILPNKLAESRLLVNLFFSQLINQNTKELPQSNPDLKHQCLLLMDEFTSIGKVEIIAHAVSYMAGYNIRLFPIIQSVAQLDAVYGKEYARTIITNHALQIIYTPREQQDANDYSEMLGYTTIRKKNLSKGREKSYSYSDERRALMLPQELKAMSQEKEIILYEGLAHPVMAGKIRYYQERFFTKKLMKPSELMF